MDGEAFEDALGIFLAWERSLATASTLSTLGEEQYGRSSGQSVFPGWLSRAGSRAKLFRDIIWNSIYSNFGPEAISTNAGTKEAYGFLLEWLGIEGLTVATTNYDTSIVEALTALDLVPDLGRKRHHDDQRCHATAWSPRPL